MNNQNINNQYPQQYDSNGIIPHKDNQFYYNNIVSPQREEIMNYINYLKNCLNYKDLAISNLIEKQGHLSVHLNDGFPDGFLHLVDMNGKHIEYFADGIVSFAVKVNYDKYFDKESDIFFSVKSSSGRTKEFYVPKSVIRSNKIIDLFQTDGGLYFESAKTMSKSRQLLSNYLSRKYNSVGEITHFYHPGWFKVDNGYKYLYKEAIQISEVDSPLNRRSLTKKESQLHEVEVIKNIFDEVNNSFKNSEISSIILTWFHYSLLHTLFKDIKNTTIPKILVLSGERNVCQDIAKRFLCPFSDNKLNTIPLTGKQKALEKNIFESKDEVMIFLDNDNDKSEYQKGELKKNHEFLVNTFVNKTSFEKHLKSSNTIIDISAQSSAAIISNSILCDSAAGNFIVLDINDDETFNEDYFRSIQLQQNLLSDYVFNFINHVENNCAAIKNTIEEDITKYLCDDIKFENPNSKKAYAILMSTANCMNTYYKRCCFDSTLDFKKGITAVLVDNAEYENASIICRDFKAALKEFIASAKLNKIRNTKENLKNNIQIDENYPTIFFDDECMYISQDDIKPHIIRLMPYDIKTITVLKSLGNDRYLKRANSTTYTYRDTFYDSSVKPPRKYKVAIYRRFFEEIGTRSFF